MIRMRKTIKEINKERWETGRTDGWKEGRNKGGKNERNKEEHKVGKIKRKKKDWKK